MRTFIVVTYRRVLAGENGELSFFEPGDYFTRDTFEDALQTFETGLWAGNTCELWFHDPMGWSRIRFQSNDHDHNNYVG